MSKQIEQAKTFKSLHIKGNPIVLFNIWDAGSAKAVAAAGAVAIATGSAPVAMANGYADGEKIPLQMALDNISRIAEAVELPLSMDLEGGYGGEPAAVAETVTRALAASAVGINFEDQVVGGEGLHGVEIQSGRLAAAREASDKSGVPCFINARTDIFLKAKPDTHNEAMLNEAIERAKAFEQAGADGFFAPGLADETMIGKLCEAVNLPVNIIALPHVPPKARLIELGVARISYGPVPYKQMLQFVEDGARAAFA